MLAPVSAPVNDALGAGLSEGFDPNGIPADVSRRPGDGTPGRPQLRQRRRQTHRQRGRHRGRHHARAGHQRLARPAALQPRSGPHAGAGQLAIRHPGARPAAVGLVPAARQRGRRPGRCWWCRAAGRFDPGEVQVQWATDEQAAANKPGGVNPDSPTSGRRRPGATCGLPLSAIPPARHPGPAGRQRRRPGAAALDRGHTAADPAAAHAAGRGRLATIRCSWTGWSVWPSRASGRSAIRTASTRCRSGASCPTGSAPRPTRR